MLITVSAFNCKARSVPHFTSETSA
uniref:Uncharacterized protein n=1 Tax=Rhizophora mucronata TaxID=61149 RepID=A0A2P2P2T7_RHIMU